MYVLNNSDLPITTKYGGDHFDDWGAKAIVLKPGQYTRTIEINGSRRFLTEACITHVTDLQRQGKVGLVRWDGEVATLSAACAQSASQAKASVTRERRRWRQENRKKPADKQMNEEDMLCDDVQFLGYPKDDPRRQWYDKYTWLDIWKNRIADLEGLEKNAETITIDQLTCLHDPAMSEKDKTTVQELRTQVGKETRRRMEAEEKLAKVASK